MLGNVEYGKIIGKLDEKRMREQLALDARRMEIYEKIPRIREIDNEIASLSVGYARAALLGGDHKDIRGDVAGLADEKRNILAGAGYGADYLEMHYECPVCRDTGFIEGRKCGCLLKLISLANLERSGLDRSFGGQDFSAFDITLFDDSRPEPATGLTVRRNMERALALAKDYVSDFGNGRNLLFYGPTGTGKTFLSNCIAKAIMDRSEYAVAYYSACDFFDVRKAAEFGQEDRDGVAESMIEKADLLIIDDLGVEISSQVSSSLLYDTINGRLLSRRSTIINTNLSLPDLNERYSARIFSRLCEGYDFFSFFGPDLRMR